MSRTFDGTGIDWVLASAVESGAVPHVAAIAADVDGVFYEGGAGVRIAGESSDPVTTSTQFRIMSMTKMVVTTAALQQVELGQLDFSAPVADYVPEFAEVQVLVGFDGDEPILRAPGSKATVHQLVTHTSGLGYSFWNDKLMRYEVAPTVPDLTPGPGNALEMPLVADPGTDFVYGTSTDWLGKIVEAVGGADLDAIIREGITGPLRMDDTMFFLDEARTANAVTVHVKGDDGAWASIGEVLDQQPGRYAGGYGLYSTPTDYIRFERALLRGGELDGARILSSAMVDAAFRNQIGSVDFPAVIPTADPATADTMYAGPGHKWGYGLLLNTDDLPGRRRAGTGGWSGLFNTHFFIDRATGIAASIYTNSLPFISHDEAWKLYGDFEDALYAAL